MNHLARPCCFGDVHASSRRRILWSVIATLAVGGLLGGCKTYQVTTEPAGGTVVARGADGRVVKAGATPLTVPRSFNRGAMTLDATPSRDQAREYDTTTLTVTREEAEQGGWRVVVRLDESLYVDLLSLLLVSIDGQTRGLLTPTRSFRDTTEQGGSAPQLIHNLGEGVGVQGMSLSPDGRRLTFSEVRPAGGEVLRMGTDQPLVAVNVRLRALNLAGGGVAQVTDEDFLDEFPAYTADGGHILFSSNRRRSNGSDLLRISAAGRGGVANIYVDSSGNHAVKPTQAGDGTIAYCLYTDDNRSKGQIWTVGGPAQFPTQIALGRDPAIHPKGTSIAYVGDDGNIWTCDVNGGDKVQLTQRAGDIQRRYEQSLPASELILYRRALDAGSGVRPFSFPTWSGDGRYLLYTSMEGNDPTGRPQEDIWVLDLTTGDRQQLTTNFSTDRFPLMTPDGKGVYLLSNRGRSWGIWRIPFGN